MHLPETAKVIIADDAPAMLTGLRRALARLGCTNVIATENGEEAWGALNDNPDAALIVSDWNMEPMDGLALLTAVRARPEFKSLPFILVSADANPTLREKAVKLGVSLVLAKPFDAETLRRAIAAL